MSRKNKIGLPPSDDDRRRYIAMSCLPNNRQRKEDGKKKRRDTLGREIPPQIIELWSRKTEVTAILDRVGKIKDALLRVDADRDLLYREVNIRSSLAAIHELDQQIKLAMPYAVCPICQGITCEDCRMCLGRGIISRYRWNKVVPKETRKVVVGCVHPTDEF